MKVNGIPIDVYSLCKNQTQEWKSVMQEQIDDSVQAGISAERVNTIQNGLNLSDTEAKLSLLPIAALFAQVPISNFPVGALCGGASGNFYFGANIEFPNGSLGNTIHAEQMSIVNALSHEEKSIKSITVSAPPCGYCRQFINELEEAAELSVLVPQRTAESFADLFPFAFGPQTLGVKGGMNQSGNHHLRIVGANRSDSVLERALSAANRSYAPYSKNYAGIAMRLDSGAVMSGSYLESAAYNPSISPFQSAIVNLIVHGYAFSDIREVVLVQVRNSLCNVLDSTRNMLSLLGRDGIELRAYDATY